MKCSLVYGIPLTVPGDFLSNPSGPPDQRTHLQQLRERFNSLVLIPTSHHREIPSQVTPNLHQAKFVFVWRDRHCPGLQHPYEEPFEVLESHPKFFELNIKGKTKHVSVDRLKPAHLNWSDTRIPFCQRLESTPMLLAMVERFTPLIKLILVLGGAM